MGNIFGGSPAKYIVDFGGEWVDVRPYFFVALASDERSRENIAEKYMKKKWLYFSHYQKSIYRNHPLLQCYPIEMEKTIKMAVGLYEEAEASGDFSNLMSVAKFAYRDLYRFIEQRKMYDESEYHTYFLKRNKSGIASTKDYVHSTFVAVFLCFTWNKNFSLTLDTANSMIGILQTPNTPEKRREKWEKNLGYVREKVEVLKDLHALDSFKPGQSIWEMHAIEMGKVEALIREGKEDESDLMEQVNQRMATLIFFGDVLEAAGIDPIEVQTVSLTEEEFRNILMEFTLLVDDYPATRLQFNQVFPTIFYMRRLAKMYNDAKKAFLDTSEEEKYLVVQEKQKAIAEKEDELKRLEEKLYKREEGLRKRLKESELYAKEVERQKQAVEKEVRELRPLRKEVSAVRTMLYQGAEMSNEKEISLEEKQVHLSRERIAFFGGHPNWIQRAREWFPDARFLEVDDINRKLSFISNYDVVCINTDYFNHGFYEKLMNEVSRHDVKLVYVQGATNQERVVDMLYKGLYE